jgi:hypothetical protein
MNEMEQVEESLKSARLIHGFLMFLCGSVLAVAVYPYEQKDYSSAIAEIDTITKIDFDQFIDCSLKKAKSFAKQSDIIETYQRAFDSALKHELEKDGFVYTPSQSLNHEVFLAAFDEDYVRSLLHNGTIEDYLDFIAENIGINSVFVQPEHLATAFVKKIHELNISSENKIIGTQLVLPRPIYMKHEPKYLTTTLVLAVLKPNGNIGSHLAVVENPPVSLTGSFDKTRFQEWLSEEKLLTQFVEHRRLDNQYYTKESIFPHLRSVWSLVKDKVPEEAKRVLLLEAEQSLRMISLFNVDIPSFMVVLAGPLLAIILLSYFLSYAQHIQRICQPGMETFNTFPWLPLFPNLIPRAVFFTSIFLLPLLFGYQLLRFRHVRAMYWWVGVIGTFVSAILAYFSWKSIFTLKRTCGSARADL